MDHFQQLPWLSDNFSEGFFVQTCFHQQFAVGYFEVLPLVWNAQKNPLKLGVSLHWYKIQTYQVLGQISRWCRNEVTGPKIDLVVLGYYGLFQVFTCWLIPGMVTVTSHQSPSPCCSRAQLYVACSGARKMEGCTGSWPGGSSLCIWGCHWLSVELKQPKCVIIPNIQRGENEGQQPQPIRFPDLTKLLQTRMCIWKVDEFWGAKNQRRCKLLGWWWWRWHLAFCDKW